MARYEMQELSFDVPDDFKDESVNVFVPKSAPHGALTITVSREPRSGATLDDQVKTLLDQATEALGVRVLGHRPRKINTVPAYEARSHSVLNDSPIYQRHAFVTYYDTLMSFTVSAARSQSAKCDGIAERVFDSVKLRKA